MKFVLFKAIFIAFWIGQKAEFLHAAEPREVAPGVMLVGHIDNPRINESSGIVASRRYPELFWTHNDGRDQVLYAINRTGQSLAEFRITGGFLDDWEDIAIDDNRRLYLGDLGNNNAKRMQLAVHEIDEPDPATKSGLVQVKRSWKLRYPKAPFDCESLFVYQTNGYVVSKVFNDARAELYRFPLTEPKEPVVLEFVARLKIESPVTAADISADGKMLALVAKSGAFVYRINGDIASVANLKPAQTKFRHEHIEACCFVPEGLLATAESREIYLFTNEAFRATRAPASTP
jgi:hypothetical protein